MCPLLADAAESVLREKPTIDFALVALARALALPRGAALTLFAMTFVLNTVAETIRQRFRKRAYEL